MSSVIRSVNELKTPLMRFVKAETPTYNDGATDRVFPFSYSNGILDITYSGNNFKSLMVDIANVSPRSETDTLLRVVGSPRLVTALGDNFKAYIRAWRDGTIDVGSPIEVFIPSQVVRVNEADNNNVWDTSDSFNISTVAPDSDNYVSGQSTNDYYASFVFKTPLTITIVESGITKYITFKTDFDQE